MRSCQSIASSLAGGGVGSTALLLIALSAVALSAAAFAISAALVRAALRPFTGIRYMPPDLMAAATIGLAILATDMTGVVSKVDSLNLPCSSRSPIVGCSGGQGRIVRADGWSELGKRC